MTVLGNSGGQRRGLAGEGVSRSGLRQCDLTRVEAGAKGTGQVLRREGPAVGVTAQRPQSRCQIPTQAPGLRWPRPHASPAAPRHQGGVRDGI